MEKKKIILASAYELKEDRKEFEVYIARKNKSWVDQGVFLELVIWEDQLEAMSQTRLQEEFNQRVKESDIFLMLFFTKVGQYTLEEFETAFGNFKKTNKPFIFTYFKDGQQTTPADENDMKSLVSFQERLDELGHFSSVYKNMDELKHKFDQQLEKLVDNGFIELSIDERERKEVKAYMQNAQKIYNIDKIDNATFN